jgi:isopentenyl diphosphate isomerase/L-lactate dehydrogenase-like FMN-dependent dehydrogenase
LVHSYVAGGCGDEHTQRLNVSAFRKWGIVPRMLGGAYERDLSVSLLVMDLPTPLLMSPIGVIGICAQDFHGDLQVAEAAAQTGVPPISGARASDGPDVTVV